MKTKSASILLLSLLFSLSALHAIPTDPTNPGTTPSSGTTPPQPPTPAEPSAPAQPENQPLTLADAGSTKNISLSDPNGPYVDIVLPVDGYTSWCYTQSVDSDSSLFTYSFTPKTYGFVTDPNDSSKVKASQASEWIFIPQVAGSVTFSFYAAAYDGQLFQYPYTQIYTFNINVTP